MPDGVSYHAKDISRSRETNGADRRRSSGLGEGNGPKSTSSPMTQKNRGRAVLFFALLPFHKIQGHHQKVHLTFY